MSRDARIELDWADGTYAFRLGWGQLGELQEKTDAGPYVVLNRLHSGQWRVEDVSNVIRLGLIGGGLAPAEALKIVRTYVEARPPMENVPIAQAVLAAGLIGAPEEKLGEAEGEAESDSTTSPTESSE
ncbi:gene transfer agent family protein [Mesorhizobium sp. CGMCC 1.15528]|uniref:Gene transfer agent family protein n=1 Tax=Mesorhizobium zhangyense TaxID=1776730 RepID=A0A7C9RBT3_9HYPH|nr:gene transfer agent family protein [Mesorhizobium zhangyense]NGN45182.1 gene transfer agent family protein [Mesorhizobium zhangyense]